MKSNTFYNITKNITVWLEDTFVKFLKTYLKSQYGGWFFGKVIDIAVEHLDDKVIDPVMDVLAIRIAKKYDERKTNELIAKINKARENRNENDYNQHVDDLLGGL